MVTRDDLEQLVKNRGQEAVGAAVVKIPDEDVRPALMLMVMIYQKSDEINREIFRRDQKRIAGGMSYKEAGAYFVVLPRFHPSCPSAILPDRRPFLCCLYFEVLIAIQPEM